jgi:hypothetical protein
MLNMFAYVICNKQNFANRKNKRFNGLLDYVCNMYFIVIYLPITVIYFNILYIHHHNDLIIYLILYV